MTTPKLNTTFGYAAYRMVLGHKASPEEALVGLNDHPCVVTMTAPNRSKAQPYSGATLLCLVANALGVEHTAVTNFVDNGKSPTKAQHTLVHDLVKTMVEHLGFAPSEGADFCRAVNTAVENLAANDTDDDTDEGFADIDDDDDGGFGGFADIDDDDLPTDSATTTVSGKVSMDDINAITVNADAISEALSIVTSSDPTERVFLKGSRLLPIGEVVTKNLNTDVRKGTDGIHTLWLNAKVAICALFSKKESLSIGGGNGRIGVTYHIDGWSKRNEKGAKAQNSHTMPLTEKGAVYGMTGVFVRFVLTTGYDGTGDPRDYLTADAISHLATYVGSDGRSMFKDDVRYRTVEGTLSDAFTWDLPYNPDNGNAEATVYTNDPMASAQSWL